MLTTMQNGEAKPSPAYMLSLRDPADETNDLGRKGIAIKHVQVTLRYLRDQLIRDTKANTRPSILSPLVGTSYMLQLERRKKLQDYGRFWWENEHKDLARLAKEMREAGSAQEASSPVLSLDGGVVQRPNEVEAAVPKALKKQAKEEAKGEEALKKQIEEEETRLRLAREVRDEEWKKLTEERNARLRNEAEKTSLLEHSDAMTSILGMPAVEEETKTSRDRVEEESEEVKGASSAF
jgi:non-canonical poly(A) RNA polymerase PAPD5/7